MHAYGNGEGEQTGGIDKGSRLRERGHCTILTSTTRKHTSEDRNTRALARARAHARTHTHTHAHAPHGNTTGLLHSRLFIHGAFGAFIHRDGGVTSSMSMSVAIGRTRASTCTRHTDNKQGTTQHGDGQHGRRKPLLRPGKQPEPKSKSEDAPQRSALGKQ